MNAVAARAHELQYNVWAHDLYLPHGATSYDYMIVEGGRGSSKTFEASRALAIKMHQQTLRVCIAREHKESLKESLLVEIGARIQEMGLERRDCFRIGAKTVDHANGSHLFGIGLSTASEEAIKGLARVDIACVEEAQRMSRKAWERLRPTIRKDFSQIWAIYNAQFRTDAIYEFARRDDPRIWFKTVTWRDNVYFTARNNRDRLSDKLAEPDRYAHIWEGEPDDGDASRQILPYMLLERCVDAFRNGFAPKRGEIALCDFGMDVGEGGPDKCATVGRIGPTVYHVDMWPGEAGDLDPAARRAHSNTAGFDVWRIYYDGASAMRGPFMRVKKATGGGWGVRPVAFGGEVMGKDMFYETKQRNAQVFARRNIQMAMDVRLRAQRTVQLVGGADVDPAACLFIDPSIPNLADFLKECSKPVRRRGPTTGKWELDKRGGEEESKSPDRFDALCLAFSRGSEKGLKA